MISEEDIRGPKYFEREVIYSYDAGEDLYFLRGFENIISIYYRDYITSTQFASISSENPKFQTVKMLLRKNRLPYNEKDGELWFSIKPGIVSIMDQRERETIPLHRIGTGYFAPFNLYFKGRIYRHFQFPMKDEEKVSDRLIAMNYYINDKKNPSYFRIDYIGKQKGILNFLKLYGNIRLKKLIFSYESETGPENAYLLILPGTDRFHLLGDDGIIDSMNVEEFQEIYKGVSNIWENIHKVPLEMKCAKRDGRIAISIIMEDNYTNHFFSQLSKLNLENIRVEYFSDIPI